MSIPSQRIRVRKSNEIIPEMDAIQAFKSDPEVKVKSKTDNLSIYFTLVSLIVKLMIECTRGAEMVNPSV